MFYVTIFTKEMRVPSHCWQRHWFTLINTQNCLTQVGYVSLRGRLYIHTCRPTSTRRAIFDERRICSVTFTVGVRNTSRWQYFGNTSRWWPIRPILSFWGAKFPKMGYSLPRTPMHHRSKKFEIHVQSQLLSEDIVTCNERPIFRLGC